MPLIKAANIPAGLQPFSLADIEQQARGILSRAQKRAEQILIEAQKEAELIKVEAGSEARSAGLRQGTEEGRAAGRQAGHEQALAEHRQKLTELVGALSAAARSLDSDRQRLETEATQDVIRLAIAIAERVSKRMGVLDGSVVVANVTAALRLVVAHNDLRICLHPSQKAVMSDALPRLALEWPVLLHAELSEDANVAPGGCLLLTHQGQIHADLDGQINRIAAELVPERASAEQPSAAGGN